jgi:spore coat protein CotH
VSTRAARAPFDIGRESGLTTDDLFDGDVLHDIWIHMNARDWAQLRATADENTYYPCDFEWRGLKAFNAGCRSRGAYTRNGIKPGLLVEFGHYVTGQTFLGLTSVVLRNLWQDPSMLKERIAMQIFRRMGVPASRGAHVRLFVGAAREYGGVYVVVEDVNEQFLARHFSSSDGYLFEYRWIAPYGFEDLGADLDAYRIRFDPRTHRSASTFELYDPIRSLIAAINESSPDELDATLEPYLDLRLFLTHVAVENFLAAWDGLLGTWSLNNFYLYRPAGSTKSVLIPWDADNTFVWLEMPPWHNVDGNVLMRKAWASPLLRAFYLRQLEATATMSSWMLVEIEREAARIRAAAAADPFKNSTTAEFEDAVQTLTLFAQQRSANIRRYLPIAARQP